MNLVEFGRMFDCSVPDILDKLRNAKNDFWRWWCSQLVSEQVGMHHAHLDRTLSHFGRLLEKLDVAPFLQEIDANPQNWTVDSKRKGIGVQSHTDAILLRVGHLIHSSGTVDLMRDIHDCAETELARQYPKLMSFLSAFRIRSARERCRGQ